MLLAGYDPAESEEVKAALLAWFCDELQDWKLEQIVWALREFNRDNPSRRPSPGHIVALLKKRRGEKYAEQVAAIAKAAPPQPVITEEARQRNLDVVSQLFPNIVKRVPEVKA